MFTTGKFKERTLGDGMDNTLLALTESTARLNLNPKHAKTILNSLKPVEAKQPIKILIPKYVPKERSQSKYLFQKQREPKFIPYEPYKCCIEPIVPSKKKVIRCVLKSDSTKNNVDINNLVEQMSEMRASELSKAAIEAIQNDDVIITKKQWETEKNALENDIKNLRETNSHLENQLKFQAQVNSELKTLLVAAVGEDLETRVQHLTEDKLQLARALLNSASHLTSHQEQLEWLSGQCEVWRSKFLASSLMVEELARWKSALTHRVGEFQESTKGLLEERSEACCALLGSQRCLMEVLEHLGGELRIEEGDFMELCGNIMKLAEHVKNGLNVESGSVPENVKVKHSRAEKMAYQV